MILRMSGCASALFPPLVLDFEQFHAFRVNVELEQRVGEVCCHAFEELFAGDVFGLHGVSVAAMLWTLFEQRTKHPF